GATVAAAAIDAPIEGMSTAAEYAAHTDPPDACATQLKTLPVDGLIIGSTVADVTVQAPERSIVVKFAGRVTITVAPELWAIAFVPLTPRVTNTVVPFSELIFISSLSTYKYSYE